MGIQSLIKKGSPPKKDYFQFATVLSDTLSWGEKVKDLSLVSIIGISNFFRKLTKDF